MSQAYAAVQTFNYISLDEKPLYANASVLPYANPKAPIGGSIVLPATGTFDNFNSMNGKGSPADGVQFLYDKLMSSSLDEPGVMYPMLATSATYDPDKPKYVIFHLNPKARFSDGSPVTAQDVVYTFKKLLSEGAPGLRIYFSEVEDIKALSKYDVRFDFKSDDNKEMPLIVSDISIFSEKDLKNKDFTRVTMQAPMGSGPYLVDKIDAGRSITYKRNPNYWGKDVMVNKGAYNFNQIKYVYYRTLDIAFEGFKTGQYTFQTEYVSRRWATEYTFNAANAGLIKKIEFQHHNPIPTQSFILNSRRKPLDDIFFRQALSYAYDFEWQNKALFYGKYKRLQSFFDNSELAATGKPSAAELKVLNPYLNQLAPVVKRGVLIDWKYPVSDASGFNRYNLMVARQMLLNKGYRYNPQGQLLDKQGKVIRFEFLIHQDGLERTLMPFVRNLKKLGITITVRKVDVPQYIERKKNYDYDITTDVMPQSLTPGNEQARFWSSQSADEQGNYNYAGVKDPVIDAIINRIIRSQHREELVTNTKVLDRLLRAGYYQILTYGKGEDWYAFWDMYDYPAVQPKLGVGLNYWWVNPAKAQKVNQYLKRQ
ncbi:extracellular solute-binding protein [Acinetobacter puyangensis]|uniref:Peptide/nickel transport system substrate-binding protein/microcin C transport system substrate-binding protein n=2 Tax=Acinetobacter puyangensis TaxID=1096779 RepID=A0A240EB24_9GAMM|nr:peptide/nickel transport system substrate-binding protein/microcin C transport system substrate-binding protein [Acinetobacter puyangensis]